MAFDAFSAGVEIGGLRSKNDIKILICYLLKSISTPLSEEDIVSVLQENNLANYFEVVSAFEDLKNMNNIYSYDKNELYSVTETGKLCKRKNFKYCHKSSFKKAARKRKYS